MASVISNAAGRVGTGFSKPYVAVYNASGTTISYTNGQLLARGVSASLDITSSDQNTFYADNQSAETAAGTFTDGTVSLAVDGLLMAAEKLIMGLPEAGTDGFTAYGDDQLQPYCGLGFIYRYMSGGTPCFVPVVLPKVMFDEINQDLSTQEEEIDWQTQDLTANIYRDDSANHVWRYMGSEYATESEAEAAIKTKLGITGE